MKSEPFACSFRLSAAITIYFRGEIMRNKSFLNLLLLTFSLCLASFVPAFGQAGDEAVPASPENSTTIVISQAYGGGGGTGFYQFDYVELKNISGAVQSLNGLSLIYGSATGQFGSVATNVFALPNTSLNPGQYYLVQLSPAGASGAALPVTPDVITTNLNMSGTSGKVALVTAAFTANTCGATATPCSLPNPAIIDLVAWGTSNNAEGGSPTNGGAALTSAQGNVRASGGCAEIDNNNLDFQVVTNPVPRNTSTAAAPCGSVSVAKLFTSYLNGASEVPVNASAGTGYGRIVLNAAETQITASFYWSGLGSSAVAGHIHGPAPAGVNAAVLFPMSPITAATSGSAEDRTFTVTAAQVAQLRAGLFYFNIHSTNFPGGEIRGQILPTSAAADYSGDGKTDFGILRQGSGGATGSQTWFIKVNGSPSEVQRVWGFNLDVPVPADYDGDGKADIAVWRQSGIPTFYILRSSDSTFQVTQFGVSGDTPIPADYTGDGRADPAIYRAGSPSTFWYFPSSGPFVGRPVAVPWGGASDIPNPGDFNGDGKADFCVVQSGGGLYSFNIRYGTDTVAPGQPDSLTFFGLSTDSVVSGDYDGDGKADLAVTRVENGAFSWYYLPSSGGQYQRLVWGLPSDEQVPGDYDGDGKTDVAVWRPSSTPGTSAFYVLGTQSGFIFQQYGLNFNTDTPVNFNVLQ